ncbi:MAG: MBL fold metallo-hydrolase [bacterium]|nr:MBL fold metallo-hydrolase [bacterium]
MAIALSWLGQSGLRLETQAGVLYVDPYLSHSVENIYGPDYRRMRPIPMAAQDVRDADFVLITHEHLDHCDPETIPALAQASPDAAFLAPYEVGKSLEGFGVGPERIVQPCEDWIPLGPGTQVHPVPAAHPVVERDGHGSLRYLGYVIDCGGRRIYHAGDTSPHDHVIEAVKALAPIDTAVLPVNEFNFFRSRKGIVGNMSVREAFALAEEIDARNVVPIHWDMFEPNCAYREEIELVYRKQYPGSEPPFALVFEPAEL